MQDPLISQRQAFRIHIFRHFGRIQIHHDKAGSIPHLIGKIPAGFYPLPVKTHIVTGRVAGHQRQPEGVRAVLVDHLQRIYSISQGFTHFPALRVPHQAVDQHMLKRRSACLLQA